MLIEISGELKAMKNTSKVTSNQVLMLARCTEAQRTQTAVLNDLKVYQIFNALQSQKQKKYKQTPHHCQKSTCKYCGSSNPPQTCPAYWKRCIKYKMDHYNVVCRNVRHKTVQELEQEIDEYPEGDSQTDIVNIDIINSNAKSPDITAKLETSIYQNSANILCKIDMGSHSNILPFHKYKILFPRSKERLL